MTEPRVFGVVAPGFETVRHAFVETLRADPDAGAGFAVWRGGRLAVDLWGGWATPGRPWTETTLVNVWSVTKALAAIAVAQLVEEGRLDYDAPVARWWPEFAAGGKGEITLGEVTAHLGRLPGIAAPRLSLADLFDHDAYVDAFAAAEPPLPAGALAYHSMSYGHLLDAVARRACGRRLASLIRERVAGDLADAVFVGLPDAEEPRVAPILIGEGVWEAKRELAETHPEAAALMGNPLVRPDAPNFRAWRAAEIPAGNGFATARALAALFGRLMSGALLPRGMTALATAERATGVGALFSENLRFGAGFMLNVDGIYGPNADAFGHPGWGGSTAFADPVAGVAVAHATNHMLAEAPAKARRDRLLDAVFAAL